MYKSENDISTGAMARMSSMYQLRRIEAERNNRAMAIAFDNLHPRVKKLLAKNRKFIVIGEHESYYMDVYAIIREHETRKGTWTEEDEAAFAASQLANTEHAKPDSVH